MKNVGHFTSDKNLTHAENIERAISQLPETCLLCENKGEQVVAIVSEPTSTFAKMIQTPKKHQRLAFCMICSECLKNPKYEANIKRKVLDRVSPDRN